MPKACERMKSTGRNVLMAVQRLQAEPQSVVAKENMVTAARSLLQATVKVPALFWEVTVYRPQNQT